MEEKLRIGERVRAVSAHEEEESGRLRLEIDGVAIDAEVVASSGQRHLVRLGTGLEEIFTVRSHAGVWVWHGGRVRLVAREPRERPTPSPPHGAPTTRACGVPPGAVTPPMPSIVVAVLVSEGQRVERGEPLVVVSAMKTESQLASPVAGYVRAVRASVGAKVRPGEILVEVETAEATDGG
jgi:biotin carboxyl carrier protein